MTQYEKVYDVLKRMNIPYKTVEHPAVFTIEDANKITLDLDGVHAKTLFMRSKKSKVYYMVIMDGMKRLDIKQLERTLEEKNIHFCSPERLLEKTGLTPGSVSVFGLLNDEAHDIRVCLDQKILSESAILFHPNDNTKTVSISVDHMLKFIKEQKNEYVIVDL